MPTATDLLEMVTLPEGSGSAANAANETRQPNAISHVANNFFVITVCSRGQEINCITGLPEPLLLFGAGTNTESSSRTPRRDKPPSASQIGPYTKTAKSHAGSSGGLACFGRNPAHSCELE